MIYEIYFRIIKIFYTNYHIIRRPIPITCLSYHTKAPAYLRMHTQH